MRAYPPIPPTGERVQVNNEYAGGREVKGVPSNQFALVPPLHSY